MSDWSTVYEAPEGWVTVERTPVRDPSGTHWHYAVSSGSAFAGVVIVATRESSVLLVRSHRLVLDRQMWEFPRGFGEPEDLLAGSEVPAYLAAAHRELLEETGLTSADGRFLGVIHPNSGLLKDAVGVVHLKVEGGQATARSEVDEVAWVSWARLDRMVASQQVTDGFTLAAMTMTRSMSGPVAEP